MRDVWVTALFTLGLLCLGCDIPEREAVEQTTPRQEIAFAFSEAAPASASSQVAQLTYSVAAPDGSQEMKWLDEKQISGAEVKLDLCTIRTRPFVCEPRITARGKQTARVDCCYTLCVRDAAGRHVGDFEVNEWGALILKPNTVAADVKYERGSSAEHTVYFFSVRKPGGEKEALLALEYERNEHCTKREVTGNDGWEYSFWAPDGRLLVHPPTGLNAMLKELGLAGSAEDEQRMKDLKQWVKTQDAQRCRSGGG